MCFCNLQRNKRKLDRFIPLYICWDGFRWDAINTISTRLNWVELSWPDFSTTTAGLEQQEGLWRERVKNRSAPAPRGLRQQQRPNVSQRDLHQRIRLVHSYPITLRLRSPDELKPRQPPVDETGLRGVGMKAIRYGQQTQQGWYCTEHDQISSNTSHTTPVHVLDHNAVFSW